MEVKTAKGLPGEFLLIFTLLIWILFVLIYLSNSKNKLNRWCFISGIVFSMGIFKEYLFFTLFPYLIEYDPSFMTETLSLQIYSVLTAVLYYFAMPTVMIFGFYFCHLDTKHPHLFKLSRWLVFIPCIVYAVFCPYIDTRSFQLYNAGYYISVAIYNWCYGILSTIMIIKPLIDERLRCQYKQRKMVAIIVLLPVWYWLISAFPVHILGLQQYFKAWQGNIVIILGLLIYYIYNVFQDGIWGSRLQKETYDWTSDVKAIQKNAQYLGHTLKNEISKIEWCVSILRNHSGDNSQKELDIINRSAEHLKSFVHKTRIYAQEITISPEPCDIQSIFKACITDCENNKNKDILFQICRCDKQPLICDQDHIIEVLYNLLNNAIDAIDKKGVVQLSYSSQPRKKEAVITITDSGCGIAKENMRLVFDPYHTTKATNQHLGLGLYYCYHVMDQHKGCIKVKSMYKQGCSFTLHFPIAKEKRGLINEAKN